MTNIVYLNGEFLPYNKATIPIATHALHYGTGCFEGIRGYWAKNKLLVFRLDDHYERLRRSAKTLHMKLPKTDLSKITVELLKKNKYKEGVYIRPLLYKSSETVTKFNLDLLDDGFAIYVCPLGHYLNVTDGITATISPWQRVSAKAIPPHAKPTGIYLNTALAKTRADLEGAGEAILLNPDGSVSEGSAENIFMVKNNVLVTPSSDQNILEGITRDTIIRLAKDLGIKTIERKIMAEELTTADEIFLSGTGAEVTPIVKINRTAKAIGPLTKKLQNTYFSLVHGEVKDQYNWITEVSYAG